MPFSELHYLVCSSFTMLLGIYIPFLFFLRPYLVFPAARHSESCSVVFESHDGKLGCDENFNKVNLSLFEVLGFHDSDFTLWSTKVILGATIT